MLTVSRDSKQATTLDVYRSRNDVRAGVSGWLGLSGRRVLVAPVLFLASHHASFINGHILYIDAARIVV